MYSKSIVTIIFLPVGDSAFSTYHSNWSLFIVWYKLCVPHTYNFHSIIFLVTRVAKPHKKPFSRKIDTESTFFQKEIELRQQLGYPPFSHLACLRFQGNSHQRTSFAAERLGERCQEILRGWRKRGKEIQVLGPVEAPLAKLKGKYRRQILIKKTNLDEGATRISMENRIVFASIGEAREAGYTPAKNCKALR